MSVQGSTYMDQVLMYHGAVWPLCQRIHRTPAPGPATALKALAQGLVAHIAAVLTFDSWAASALAAGMRSVRSPTRHLLFSAQGRDIDLRISPVGALYTLRGQILGPDDSGSVELALQGDDAAPTSVVLDALGEFRIEGLQPGTYAMALQLGGQRIVLPPVDVGEPKA
jgi:hypothetical protein